MQFISIKNVYSMLHHINNVHNVLIAVNDHVASKFVSHKNNVDIFIRVTG